jgi:hypothetical protein
VKNSELLWAGLKLTTIRLYVYYKVVTVKSFEPKGLSIAPKTLANFLDRMTQLYEQGADVRRIGEYVREFWLLQTRSRHKTISLLFHSLYISGMIASPHRSR